MAVCLLPFHSFQITDSSSHHEPEISVGRLVAGLYGPTVPFIAHLILSFHFSYIVAVRLIKERAGGKEGSKNPDIVLIVD